jgi:hypothetical protein
MADYTEEKTSAQLEREVEAQRDRVQDRISDIQDKLSPGQMVDELLTYAKNKGGGEFVTKLGRNVSGNPLPVALLGISLLWLIAKPVTAQSAPVADSPTDWDRRPDTSNFDHRSFDYATVTGGMRRLRVHETAEGRHSEFADELGRKYKAATDAAGNRAGHFIDDAGRTFSGFKDIAGNRIDDFRDEAGNMLDAATGWASDTWQKAGDAVSSAGNKLSEGRDHLQARVADSGGAVQHQADQMSRTLMSVLHDQPLVAGALAFAAGAAVASAFPHTQQEDQVFGEVADKVKQQSASIASDAYDKGKAQVTEAYSHVADKAQISINRQRTA